MRYGPGQNPAARPTPQITHGMGGKPQPQLHLAPPRPAPPKPKPQLGPPTSIAHHVANYASNPGRHAAALKQLGLTNHEIGQVAAMSRATGADVTTPRQQAIINATISRNTATRSVGAGRFGRVQIPGNAGRNAGLSWGDIGHAADVAGQYTVGLGMVKPSHAPGNVLQHFGISTGLPHDVKPRGATPAELRQYAKTGRLPSAVQPEIGMVPFTPGKIFGKLFGGKAAEAKGAEAAAPAAETPKAAAQKVQEAIPSARTAAAQQKQVTRAARAAKFGKAQAAGEKAGGGIEGLHAELGALKGPLPKVKFEKLKEGNISEADVEGLMRDVASHPDLKWTESLRGRVALTKAFHGESLQPNEINILERVFGKDAADVLANKSFARRVGENAVGVLNLPRALMASIDISFPGRQGLGVLAASPRIWGKGFGPQLHGLVSEQYYQKMLDHLHQDPYFDRSNEAGVKYTELGRGAQQREEPFITNLLTNRPTKFNPVRASARAYTMYGDYVRLELFKKYVKMAERKGVPVTPKEERGIARVVNTLSGRGGGKRLQQASPIVSPLIFAPQLIASRLNMLNPLWYSRLGPVESAFARRQARIAGARLYGGAGALLGGAAAAGVNVQADPRSADFAKLRFGNTRIDVLGGLQQYPRALAQILSGKVISSTTGRTMTLGPGVGKMSRLDIIQRFLTGKASPPASAAIDVLKGKTFTGQPITPKQEILSHTVPLAVQDALDILHNKGGSIPKAIAGYGLSATGVGVQTYGPNRPGQSKLQKFVKNDLSQAIKNTPGVQMTPELQGRIALRMERVKAREATDPHDPVKRLTADISVIQRHGWITAKQAAAWEKGLKAKDATPRDYSDVSRYLTEHYFDQGHELSAAVQYLAEHGNPKLKLPPLPGH